MLLAVNLAPRLSLLLLYALYLSLLYAGQTFMDFQWDTFLLETGFGQRDEPPPQPSDAVSLILKAGKARRAEAEIQPPSNETAKFIVACAKKARGGK